MINIIHSRSRYIITQIRSKFARLQFMLQDHDLKFWNSYVSKHVQCELTTVRKQHNV